MLARLSVFAISLLSLTTLSFAAGSPLKNSNSICQLNTTFHVGTGIYDITGPAAEEGMMGYGMLQQQTAGILQRLWARAFVIESTCNNKRVVFVNTDLGMIFQGVKQQVIAKLKNKYGNRYTDENVLLTATHTHSGPGGFSTYAFYNLTTLGFNKKNFDTIVDGIVTAIERAQDNLQLAQLKIASAELPDVGYSRSPESYLLNPAAERQQYAFDTDKTMTLLRFETIFRQPFAMLNWFPVHGVSLNNKNYLIGSDNKGLAEYLFEKDFNSDYGAKSFVAAFAQANAGDVSPNQYGHEGGAGAEGILAVETAGQKQYRMAKQLFNSATQVITGGVDYRHEYVAMDQVVVAPQYTDGTMQSTCPAAIGVSMLAGTQDGEGVGKQGMTCTEINKTFPGIGCSLTTTPCQGVKPIALETGTKRPYPWTPNILPLQIVKIGNLVIVAAPFELTTMTGRRIRAAVAKQFAQEKNITVVISALSNAYSGYVATNEEYQLQRYEGASTHFGPWTQAALVQEFSKLAYALTEDMFVPAGPTPADLLGSQTNLQPGVLFDDKPFNKDFGAVYQDVQPIYKPGDTVQAVFWGAHPKNNYRTQDTFLAVQKLENGVWQTILRDRDWGTEYHWQRSGVANSLITIVWHIPADAKPGQYRIQQYGDWKSGWTGAITPYVGTSSVFKITLSSSS